MVAITSNLAAIYDGAPVITDRNYAPSLYGPTVPVEVYRNVATNPILGVSNTNLTPVRVSVALGDGCTVATITDAVAVSAAQRVSFITTISRIPAVAGDVVRMRMEVGESTQTQPFVLVAHCYNASNTVLQSFMGVVLPGIGASTPFTPLTHEITAPAGTVTVAWELAIYGTNARAVGDTFKLRRAQASVNQPLGDFFADGYPSPDPDMTPELVPSGNGASRLMGQHPTGFLDVNCVSIIHEVGDGTRELRQIPTGSSSNSFSDFAVPVAARAGGTVLGTSRIPASLSGVLDRPNSVGAYSPTYINSNPATAGTYDQRFVYSSLTSTYRAVLRHGGSAGSGDVYWSKIGLYAGDYDGEWFTGTTVSTDPHILYGWEGTPHASPATKSYRRFKHQGRTDPLLIAGWDETAESGTVVHHLMNGTVDATPRPAQLRSGVFALIYNDKVLAHEARRLFAAAGTYTLNHDSDPDLAMVFVAVGKIGLEYQADQNGEHTWVVTVGYQQVTA